MKYFIILILIIPNLIFAQNLVLKYFDGNNIEEGGGLTISIDCPDSLNCYIITQTEDIHKIYKSSNKGNSWDLIYKSKPLFEQTPPPLINAQDACSPHPNYYFIAMFQSRHIKKSDDGCKSFDNINLGSGGTILQSLRQIAMKDTNTGIVIGDSLFAAITNDSWKNFRKIDYNNDISRKGDIGPLSITCPLFRGKDTILFFGALYNYKDSTIIDIDSSSLGTGIFTWNYKKNESSYVLIPETKWDTTNGNHNPIYESLNDMYFVNDTLGFVCGGKKLGIGQASIDVIYKTTNKGATWFKIHEQQYQPYFGLQKISFKDDMNGVAVGQFGKVIVTGNGGETWEYLYIPDTLKYRQPATLKITWAGEYPIIGTWGAGFWRVEGPDGGPPVFKTAVLPSILTEDHNFGKHYISFPDTLMRNLKINNLSDTVDLRITGYSALSEIAFSTSLPKVDFINPIIIKPQEYYEYTVFFKPYEVRKYSDSIVFYSNSKVSDNVAVFSGEGIDDTTTVDDYLNDSYFYLHQPYPQPATDEVMAKFTMNVNIDIKTININIYDIFGNNVDIKNNIKIEPNTSNSGLFKWDCTKVISGTYYLKISYGSEIRMLKIIVYNLKI